MKTGAYWEDKSVMSTYRFSMQFSIYQIDSLKNNVNFLSSKMLTLSSQTFL